MATPDPLAFTLALLVTIIGTLALMFKLMVFALALDDWWEVRGMHKHHPERMVADDEAIASAGRVAAVGLTVILGLVWLLFLFGFTNSAVVRVVLTLVVILQALLALFQGIRAMLFRRALARVINKSRRPVGPDSMPVEHHTREVPTC